MNVQTELKKNKNKTSQKTKKYFNKLKYADDCISQASFTRTRFPIDAVSKTTRFGSVYTEPM